MYNTLRNTIEKSEFRLAPMIDTITQMWWPLGRLTQAQRDELIALASEKAQPESERPETIEMIRALSARMDKELAALRSDIAALKGGAGSEESGDAAAGYEEWAPWDGISDKYRPGAIVSHGGRLWINTLQGMQNTWEPGAIGTEAVWAEYTEAEG